MKEITKIQKEVNQLYRNYFGKLVASLSYFFDLSNLQTSEDIVQDTFISAIDNWTKNGLPKNPKAWLFKVCKNKALNHLNSKSTKNNLLTEKSLFESVEIDIDYKLKQVFLNNEFEDRQLHLLFAICHPKIPLKSQIILSLKAICGFKRNEIAQGLGISEETVKKNLFRSRKLITNEGIVFNIPYLTKSFERIQTVEMVLYLLFNEGYKPTEGSSIVKYEFCLEAMKITKSMLTEIDGNLYSTKALFSLMLFNAARFEARKDTQNNLIDLESQDRTQWDKDLINLGIEYFNASKPKENMNSRFHLEAGIASIHCTTASFQQTNWQRIIQLYDKLIAINASDFIQLNKCIAIYYAQGAKKALSEISILGLEQKLGDYYLFNCTLGAIHRKPGEHKQSLAYFQIALGQAKNKIEKNSITKQIAQIQRAAMYKHNSGIRVKMKTNE